MLLEPSKATLAKYGLSLAEWQALAEGQGHRCYVCQKVPEKGRLCIDHEHVKGWKKLSAANRKMYVRGLLCWFCNHYYVSRSITPAKASRVVEYLNRYEAGKASRS